MKYFSSKKLLVAIAFCLLIFVNENFVLSLNLNNYQPHDIKNSLSSTKNFVLKEENKNKTLISIKNKENIIIPHSNVNGIKIFFFKIKIHILKCLKIF